MRAQEIRDTYLAFFADREHKIVPSASLVPSVHDPSVLLTTAGMQPFKPYFLGPATSRPRRASPTCQKCFRTTDIDEVGNTARHLTFFEMLGNFSFGDYFKADAIRLGLGALDRGLRDWTRSGSGSPSSAATRSSARPDDEAVEIWRAIGVPEERIVRLGREDNFWQAGPTGPCGPYSELYLDRGLEFGAEGDRPGDDGDRFLEFWNLVFMQYDRAEDGALHRAADEEHRHRHGPRAAGGDPPGRALGLRDRPRPAADRPRRGALRSPLRRGRRDTARCGSSPTTAAAMTFLIADGVLPSQRGPRLHPAPHRAPRGPARAAASASRRPRWARFAEPTIELMGDAYPELVAERDDDRPLVGDEEESSAAPWSAARAAGRAGRRGAAGGDAWIDGGRRLPPPRHLRLPLDLTKELPADAGLSVDDEGFEELMEEQRAARARTRTPRRRRLARTRPSRSCGGSPRAAPRPSSSATARLRHDDAALVATERGRGARWSSSRRAPFYAEGGGQVADSGRSRHWDGRAVKVDRRLPGRRRPGAVEVESDGDAIGPCGSACKHVVDRETRHATRRNHTATHVLHCGPARAARPARAPGRLAVAPDKLRFDFTHGQALSREELRDGRGARSTSGWRDHAGDAGRS